MIYLYMIKRKPFRFWIEEYSYTWSFENCPVIPKGYKDYKLIGTCKTDNCNGVLYHLDRKRVW
jgi:hypothetical protein